jgi:exopolysaccharide biosynthesis operon protein EpsL
MRQLLSKIILLTGFFSAFSTNAEGILDLNPYVSGSTMYDSNLFRFSSKSEAQAAGFTRQHDTIKRIDAGISANLRLSRQLVNFNASVNESRYSEFKFLDNTGNALRLAWQWRLGSKLSGELSASRNQSIAGFTDIDIIVNNLRTFERQRASINWQFIPDWTMYGVRETGTFENDQAVFKNLDSKDDVYEAGLRYQSQLGTQMGVFYRMVETEFPRRTAFARFFFGEAAKETQYGINLAWLPSPTTKLSAQLSAVDLAREGAPQRDFDGLNQRWTIEHMLTGKTNLQASVYKEVTPVDAFLATYAEIKGANAGLVWSATPKSSLSSSISYVHRAFLGADVGFTNAIEQSDITKRANLTFSYAPTLDAVIQIAYLAEWRDANINLQDYQFQSINFLARYNF